MIRLIKSLLVVMLTTLSITACAGAADRPSATGSPASTASPAADSDCRTIQHRGGETQVCGQPQRIVVLGPYLLEPLLALEVQPAGFADHEILHRGKYDNPSQQIPYLGSRVTSQPANVGTAYNPAIESLLKVQPDLILATEANASQYKTLSEIAPTLLLRWSDAETNLRTIAEAVDRSEKADQLLTETQQQIAAARAAFAPLVADHPRLLMLSATNAQELHLLNSENNLCTAVVKDLGFQLVYPPEFNAAEIGDSVPISPETLSQLSAADSVILLGSSSGELNSLDRMNDFENNQLKNLKQAWTANPIAQSLAASQLDRVYFIPVYLCLGLPGTIGTELYLDELQDQLLAR